jgi:hypothetical protein
MSTIIILGDKLTISQAHEAHDELVSFHFRIVPSRFQWNLEALVQDPPINPNPKHLPDYAAYLAAIKRLEESHSIWSIYDHRVVFFLPEFASLVKDARLLWNDTYPKTKADDEYIINLQKLNKAAFAEFEGHKLHLTKDPVDREAIRGLLLLPPKEAKTEAKKEK